MSDIIDVEQQVAIVTGAGQGVGREIALAFGRHKIGAVVVNDFYQDRAETVAREVEAEGGTAIAVQADVTDYGSVSRMVDLTRERFGRIDILVNNAGNAGAAPRTGSSRSVFWETEPEDWERWLKVNLYGPLNCTRAAIPQILAGGQGGRIITIISDAGRVGEAGLEVYSAAKAGAAGLNRSLALSLGRHLVTVNTVAISATATPATAAILDPSTERYKKAMSRYAIRRPGEPREVANMVLFLASRSNGWITGQTYPVNGGFSFSV